MRLSTLIVFLAILISLPSKAQTQETKSLPKRIYNTNRLVKVPVIDGYVNEDAWNVVEWSSGFTEKDPDEGTPPTYDTAFKIMYDKKYLYVAIRAFDDEPDKIESRLSRRDGFAGDRVNVIIDSYHDKRTAFVFTTTAAGVKGEELASQNGQNWDDSWNPVWWTDAKIDDKGWTAEMKIPLSQLRFGKAKEQIWGLNVNRTIFRLQERSLWQRIPNDQAGFISEAGELHGLKDLVSNKQLEIQPFVVGQYDNYPAEVGNPFRDGSDFITNAGLDAKIGITNDLTLDLTVNPDFGQVEADPGAIALDGFQIFFREQRPFFVENSNIFDFQFANGRDNLFYSRRIGRNPHDSPSLNPGEFADVPQNTTILSAAKFSGKTRDGLSVGVLESLTANEYATVREVNGEERREIVEPMTNFFVARVQQDFNERNSFLGGIFTATNRFLDGNFNDLHKAAYTAGIDFNHNWKNREYYLDGNVIFSHVMGSEEAIEKTQRAITRLFQRPGANHVAVDPTRTSLTGTGGRFEMGRAGGDKLRYNGGIIWRSPELELNDVGFLRNTDQIIQFANVDYLWLYPNKTYRNMSINFEQSTEYDFDGNLNRVRIELANNVNWIQNERTRIGIGANFSRFNNFFLRGGPRWRSANSRYMFVSFNSDSGKDFQYNLRYTNVHSDEDVFARNRFNAGFNYQVTDAFNFSLQMELEKTKDRSQYVSTRTYGNDNRYILGTIKNDQLTTTMRFTYSIDPDISIQFYGQPFISRGRYSDLKYVNIAAAERFSDRVNLYNQNQLSFQNGEFLVDENVDGTTDYTFGNPDFSFVQLQTNLVARWEYIPGSELFLVWARGSVQRGDPSDGLLDKVNDVIFNAPANDTFLIKLTYRFVR
ncbi:MAG: hydrolase [Flavobacteriaceae bacterium]|nr:hydrolase [Flavobacteriaceae bacterium]|tara:strand:- start:230085 stop:232709 length:2625 start_codon:yes stop_codon:yes gene_type:complete